MKASQRNYGYQRRAAFSLWSRRPDIGLLTMSAAALPPQQDFHQVRLECPLSERLICGHPREPKARTAWSGWDDE